MGRAGLLLLSGVAVLAISEPATAIAKPSARRIFPPAKTTGKPRLVAPPFLDQIILRIARAPASP
jgi:hypothetical protein